MRAELERVRKESKRPRGPRAEADVVVFREGESGGVNLFVAEVKEAGPDELLAISDRVKQERRPAAVFLGAREDGGRVHLLANFDKSLEQRLDAVQVIRSAAALVGGGGGGRATMARAGGKDPDKLPEALETAWRSLSDSLR